MGGVQVPDPFQPRVRPVPQLLRIRVPGPDKVPSHVSPAKEVHQAVRLLPRGLVHLVKIAGDHQAARPAVLIAGELPGLLVDARVAGQHRPGPRRGRIGPGRPAGIAPGGFPRPLRQTGLASLPASGFPRALPAVLGRFRSKFRLRCPRGWDSRSPVPVFLACHRSSSLNLSRRLRSPGSGQAELRRIFRSDSPVLPAYVRGATA